MRNAESGMRNEPRSRRAGFTLAELLIVMVILSVMAVMLVPRYEAMTNTDADERAFRLISGVIAHAQDRAVIHRQSQIVELQIDTSIIAIEGAGEPVALPKCSIAVTDPRLRKRTTEGTVRLKIDPSGTVERFELEIGDAVRAASNPITGELERARM